MKLSRRLAVNVTAVVVIVGSTGAFWWWAFEPMHLRIRLLCKTNHQALLEACQELSSQVTAHKLGAGRYRIRPWPDSRVSRFPRVIRALRPSYVFIDEDGRVLLEMFGGFTHFGVYAYPQDYNEPFPGFTYGDRQLIPNLWYYDDDYHRDPNFDQAVTRIISKYGKK